MFEFLFSFAFSLLLNVLPAGWSALKNEVKESKKRNPDTMPPPPPPSKSYLLVLDTDSEDEDGNEYYDNRIRALRHEQQQKQQRQQWQQEVDSRTISVNKPTSSPIKSGNAKSNNVNAEKYVTSIPVESDDDGGLSEPDQMGVSPSDDEKKPSNDASAGTSGSSGKLTKSQKKNRSRRRKKKNKSAASATAAAEASNKNKKKVSFSTVSARAYPRSLGTEGVPVDGGWPLGTELDSFVEEEPKPLEDYETEKQETLKKRWEDFLHAKGDDPAYAHIISNMTKRPDGIPLLLETRQWDYRSRVKNPLFTIVHEEQRQMILLESSGGPSKVENSGPSTASSPNKRRSRSNSVTSSNNGNGNGNGNDHSKKRSSETYNEKFNQVYVHHVRNELEQLRNERTKTGATGCTCRKLSVYLPPKDGSGGKRSQHRRLKPSKLTQELKKRGLYKANLSREESEIILHDAVAREPCCRDEDCFCIRNGIGCQADTCSCWHDSHVNTRSSASSVTPSGSTSTEGELSVQDIEQRCGNRYGMYVVNLDSIDEYRHKILENPIVNYCQPIA